MAMDMNDINEFQIYLQMYDKGLVSKKTVLEKIGIDWEKEKDKILEDEAFDSVRLSLGPNGVVGGPM